MRGDGWIFDVYPVAEGMRVWAILADGRRVHFLDPWRAPFVVDGADWARARSLLSTVRVALDVVAREGADLYCETVRPVFEVRVPPLIHGPLVKKLKRAGVLLYNADIPLVQNYHYERDHFPLAFGQFDFDDGQLTHFHIQDSPWSVDFSLPPLRFLHLALAGSEFSGAVNPRHASRGGLIVRHEDMTHILEGDPAEQLETLDRRIQQWDPDVLTTDWGDGYLIPHLLDWARRARRSLRLNRDGDFNVEARLGKSFMSYGRTVYQSGAHYLFGRWHLDLKNSFYFKECGWEGLFEISRIAKIPVQRAARTTIGTSLSSMQLDVALKRGLLIPLDKAQAEDFRPASDLLVADKGGLVYEPDIGWFEHIAEYDFVSMYPTLMVQHNISPETINCACCDGAVGGDEMVGARQRGNHDGGAVGGDEMVGARQRGNHDGGAVGGDEMVGARQRGNHRGFSVPEIGHHLCLRRRGLVPDVLAPLLKKRSEYKRLYKSNAPDAARYKARADAHKWCLVTCVDGKTRLPYREGGEIKVGSIRDLIDRHAQDTEGTVPLTESVEVVGLDQKGRASFCSVKQFVRKPAPSALLRIGVGGGRKINYTAEHDCLILKGGHLVKRKADQLRVGDWVPVLARLPSPENPPCHVDVFRILLERLPLNELPLWRVFGNSLGRVISDNGDAIEKNIKGDYSPLSLRNWRSGNYLPFHLVSCLSKGSWAATHVGRGKRSGGLVQKIPARLELNEGLGFFLGFYVGDGSVSGRMIRLDVGTAEKDIADFLVAFVRHQFCLNVHRYKEKGVAMEVIQINSIALIRILEVVFGLGRTSDSGKLVVPSLVLNGPR
ncbi:MAG: hypothetical protein KBG07_06645, partial [Elusimicrobia bacterium]|nr:hypothetical protein [Elusimicrobiota bacterium]